MELTPVQARDMARAMTMGGVLAVSFCGGEVLLREDLGTLLRRFHRDGVTTRVTSNGLLVPERMEDLKWAGGLKLSLDGPPDLHDHIRGAGAYEAIEAALAAARGAQLPVQVNSVLSHRLILRLEEHLETIGRLGVSVTFQPPEVRPGADEDAVRAAMPTPLALQAAAAHIVSLKRRRDRRIGNSLGTLEILARWPEQAPIDCAAGSRFCRVAADGRVLACDRPQAPHPPPQAGQAPDFARGVREMRKAGRCQGCWRNNTLEINRLLGGSAGAWDAVRRWL